MGGVTIGPGKLAGKGVYAARAFKKGELVVPYNLKELSQAEFDALPEGEWEWTHTFWGRIYLFPEPARYVNSDASPNTYPDLDPTWAHIQDEVYTISNMRWVACSYWVSACTYTFKSDGMVDGKRQVYEGYGTNVVRRIGGRWRVVHEHLSKSAPASRG